ncbi:EAL domain-containing protein [Pseudolabrys taiwanensis]|uniref:EAL domain-containing protein n=2 Tax=Pseudolabrys taiwanensis TaxID=331696 RepID=A0A346A0P0_9HYPH|nr:EAL domain-containing protein [Pseudolabrys taiwanensis]
MHNDTFAFLNHGLGTSSESIMRRPPIISRIADRLTGFTPDRDLHFELVRGLYNATSTPNAILGATAAALVVVGTAGALSDDKFFTILFFGFLLVGIARSLGSRRYFQIEHDPTAIDETKRWELNALAGAWSFALLVGITGAYALFNHAGTDVEILISCCVIGYIAGASSRNASRPLITIGQISLTCLPFLAALILRADVVHTILATFIAILYFGTIIVSRSVFENIVQRHLAFKRVETLARRDALTGIWNRGAFLELIEKRFAASAGANGHLALISIDLDRFKDINDTLGHPVGDSVLKEVAERIQSVVMPGDEVSRVGGDEFLVMLADGRARDVHNVAEAILAVLEDPFFTAETRSICGASIGYAVAPQDGASLDVLLRNADLALYKAKNIGRGQIVAYTATLSTDYDKRVALEHELQFALDNHELYLEYQPIVDPRSGRAICCEALLRWRHPTLGIIPPDVFIPIAEATGLIVPIGTWVLVTACTEAMTWHSDVKLAVNLSPVQFRRGREIVDLVTRILTTTGLPPRRLDLEITESVLLDDNAATMSLLEDLRSLGVGISLDDFGTGFASLAYLNDFPFSKIKIDRKFTQDIDESPRTLAIIKGISQIARELHIERVAEGIETFAQLERVQSFGINAIQGYVFSRPVAAAVLRELIKQPILPIVGSPSTATHHTGIGKRNRIAS